MRDQPKHALQTNKKLVLCPKIANYFIVASISMLGVVMSMTSVMKISERMTFATLRVICTSLRTW